MSGEIPETVRVGRYHVVATTGSDQLVDRVQELIGEGWFPIGGVTAAWTPPDDSTRMPEFWNFFQAMYHP